jgi:uncharacterized protein DUF1592/uncharacterized protein DUF1588/uncharacterized protein DUF1595
MPRPALFPVLAAALAFAASMPFAAAAAEVTLVRITPEQYQRSIHDIFGPSIEIEPNAVEPGFRDQGLLAVGARRLTLTPAGLERDAALAQQIAEQVTDSRRIKTLIPCEPAASDAPDAACTAKFVRNAGLLLFRRPLTDDEVQGYVTTADSSAKVMRNFAAGIGAVLMQMLVAPDFLFRLEYSTPDPADPAKMQLDAYSRASRLSFFIWDSAPDAELLAAAQSGKLLKPEGVREQVERLLDSPRVEDGLRAFFTDMMSFSAFATLTKDTGIFPKFTKNVEEDAREQTLKTIVDHLIVRNREYKDLFVTRDTFLTPSLAALYDVPLPRSQELGGAVPWVPYQFPEGDTHVGLLTQVSFVAVNSHPGTTSPTLRGKALRENLLCQTVPPPPANVDFSLVQDASNPKLKTVRQRLDAHRSAPTCAGCHRITDPVGLALENFDSSGVYRTVENGADIDTTGDFNGKHFDNIVQLAQIIRDDPGTTSCLIKRAYAYGTARAPAPAEAKWLAELQKSMGSVKWRELIRRLTASPDFFKVPAPTQMTLRSPQ